MPSFMCSTQHLTCPLPPSLPPSLRAEALDRFAVINVQYQHLADALRPLLRQFAAYPRSVNQVRAGGRGQRVGWGRRRSAPNPGLAS